MDNRLTQPSVSPANLKGFTKIPNVALFSQNLSPTAKVVYAIIRAFDWNDVRTKKPKGFSYPGQETIALAANCSVRSVQRAIKELQAHKLVKVTRFGLRSNVYYTIEIEQHDHGWVLDELGRVVREVPKPRKRRTVPRGLPVKLSGVSC